LEQEHRGKLHAPITQNIDELHRLAGRSAARIIEVHGTMRRAMCRACGGILKSDTISFGQALVPAVIDRAMAAAGVADLLLAVGSTVHVYRPRPVCHA
jgi:NAD-dependent deacetylase